MPSSRWLEEGLFLNAYVGNKLMPVIPAAEDHGPVCRTTLNFASSGRLRACALLVTIGAVLLPSLLFAQYQDEQSTVESEPSQALAGRGFLRSPDLPFA